MEVLLVDAFVVLFVDAEAKNADFVLMPEESLMLYPWEQQI